MKRRIEGFSSPLGQLLAVVIAGLMVATTVACGSDSPDGPAATPPTAPATNDPAFTVAPLRNWYIIGNATLQGNDTLALSVTAAPGTSTIDAWVADLPGQRLVKQPSGKFTASIDLRGVVAGTYDVLLAADGADVAFAHLSFKRSQPYYVLMSTDWDFSDPTAQPLDNQDQLHRDHPGLKVTQFVGPYTFTDPNVLPSRRAELATWLTDQRDTYGDEIGLHIHPYCNFVNASGVECVVDQSTVYPTDTSGYTIKVGAYGYTEFTKLLQSAKHLFQDNGLGTPRTFRAGGWTATSETLQALVDEGFIADSSAINWQYLTVWEHEGTGELYRWNMAHWSGIGDTSQPYWPNSVDPQGTKAPYAGLLEVPDNGIMVDYITTDEMVSVFGMNWDGTPLSNATTLVVGFHPSSTFSTGEFYRVDGILAYADMFLASSDWGPVVYTTLDQLPAVFTQPAK